MVSTTQGRRVDCMNIRQILRGVRGNEEAIRSFTTPGGRLDQINIPQCEELAVGIKAAHV